MKKLLSLFLMILCLTVLGGCCLKHRWLDATCVAPITCEKCGKTEGEALGHVWGEPDCVTAKTCKVCGDTDGEPLGHVWMDANCQTPKTCEVCAATEGGLGDHIWIDATTELPKTCSLCAVTEGERIITDERFTTAACKELLGIWGVSHTFTGAQLGLEGYLDEMEVTLYLRFEPDGKLDVAHKAADEEAFLKAVADLTEAFIYDTYEDKATADAEILEVSGMTVRAYAEKMAPGTAESLFDAYINDGVYYVSEGSWYYGRSWTGSMTPSAFTVGEEGLTIEAICVDAGVPLLWTKLK